MLKSRDVLTSFQLKKFFKTKMNDLYGEKIKIPMSLNLSTKVVSLSSCFVLLNYIKIS